jgi:ribosomal protein L21E
VANVAEFSVGDRVEIIAGNIFKPMPGSLAIGSRGTVIDHADAMFVHVQYDDAPKPVWSARDAIRKLPPPPREQTSTWDDVIVWRPKETSHVG